MVKVLYKIFLALMISLFIGFGISVFYSAPKAPNFSSTDYQKQYDEFRTEVENHSRNVSVIIIVISVILLVISLTALLSVDIMGDGFLLGGLFTLIYGIIRALLTGDSTYQFAAVSAGLLIVLILGYIKFIKQDKNKIADKPAAI